MSFRPDFVWGAAAAAFQIEGAAACDGKGPSVWDMFCRQPARVFEQHDGAVACDHYHRYREDVALMRAMGLHAYRLSVSWPRVMPEGRGAVNAKGLDFYDRLVDTLLEAKITPWVTLFHWDFPHALYLRGGWLNPDSPKWFSEYTACVVDRLSDRVAHWITLNEPQCFIGLGLRDGIHAPGDKLGWSEVLRAAHHALLAHGRAVQVIRARAKRPAQIGWAPCGGGSVPNDDTPSEVERSRRLTFSITRRSYWHFSWWSDPVIFGRYPEDGLRVFGADAPSWTEEEMRTIAQPLDFFGINLYLGQKHREDERGEMHEVPSPPGSPKTSFGWDLTPRALHWFPRFVQQRYGLPVVITENGLANPDWIAVDGACHDPQRIDFLTRYLAELKRAAAEGLDVRGYFQWSILDNFEWAEGYKQRFGLIHVDFQTQRRTPKDSAHWYAQTIRANGENLPERGGFEATPSRAVPAAPAVKNNSRLAKVDPVEAAAAGADHEVVADEGAHAEGVALGHGAIERAPGVAAVG
jgi:beta-glucosidase